MEAADDRSRGQTAALFDSAPPPRVAAVNPGADLQALATRLPARCRLGTSSWRFPGWDGLVWDGDYSAACLANHGLSAYARHPLLRTVSLDRAFYRPLSVAQYTAYAGAVPHDFRFVVKAPAAVTDYWIRAGQGRPARANPDFLAPEIALEHCLAPALEGLGRRLGALVFQISPLPLPARRRIGLLQERLHRFLAPLSRWLEDSPVVLAVEVRDREWLDAAFVETLRAHGATYCLGLHPRLPPIEDQLPLLRALWPGPLVCRWNLHARHGRSGYDKARADYAPFDRLVDPDPDTRHSLARVAAATATAGEEVFVTINNKAEGSAPRSVGALAAAIDRRQAAVSGSDRNRVT